MWNEPEMNSTFSSPGGNAGKEIKKSIKYVVPVNCQTLNECKQVEGENSVFELNYLKFSQICLVGLVRNVIKRANDVTYLIDDMSSNELVSVKLQADIKNCNCAGIKTIIAFTWKEPDDIQSEDIKPPQTFIEGQYVRVYGVIKSLQGQKNVQAFKILPLKDLNEITHHILDCMNASIHLHTKANGDNTYAGPSSSYGNNSFKPMGNNETSFGGLNSFQTNLVKFIKNCKNSAGVQFTDICHQFQSVSKEKIREALEFLSNEGQVYTTIDDDHFQSTDADGDN